MHKIKISYSVKILSCLIIVILGVVIYSMCGSLAGDASSFESKVIGVAPENAYTFISENTIYYENLIDSGLTKQMAGKCFPEPHNIDRDTVWFWCYGQPSGEMSWRALSRRAGIYIIFKNNKVVAGIMGTAAMSPSQAIEQLEQGLIGPSDLNE